MPEVISSPQRVSALCRAEYSYRHGGHELRIIGRGFEPCEVAAVSEGEAEFALIVEEPVVILCARFGDAIPWTAAAFVRDGPLREPGSMPPAPNSPYESRAMLHVALVDAESGRSLAERNLTLWLEFSRALGEAIRDQARIPFHPLDYKRSMARLRRRHPTDSILAASAPYRCFGSL